MSRSPLFAKLRRSFGIARMANELRISTPEAIERAQAAEEGFFAAKRSRREILVGGGALAAATFASGCVGSGGSTDDIGRTSQLARSRGGAPSIGIVGAGFAGLVCADALNGYGISSVVHDAATRVGGRCFSMGGTFSSPISIPGQTAERGGEYIDTGHKTLINLARAFGLTLEDVSKEPGEVFYYFDGQAHPESVVVDEYRALVAAMHVDLRASSGSPTALAHNEADIALDHTSLAEYLVTRGAGPVVTKAIEEAYLAEYGIEPSEQSCLAFLLFIHADKRSKFTPFGVFSDERYHVVEGNQAIAEGLRGRLAGQLRMGQALTRARKTSSGAVELTFREGSRTVTATYDAVVFAIPFSTLREVELDASLGLPDWKLRAIDELVYGTNAKMMVGFNGPHWRALGSNGAAYSDLPNCQTVWETNPTRATSRYAILTDYSGGERGARLRPDRVQDEATRFLTDLDRVFPGSLANARTDRGKYVAHLEHWPSNPLTRGSYTANHLGYFTQIADLEGPSVGNVLFAGEHASSFYVWQGFMEGAALSGLDAADEIRRAF